MCRIARRAGSIDHSFRSLIDHQHSAIGITMSGTGTEGTAFPVRIGNETLAVVELCSDRHHPKREELVDLMRDVSRQVGRVIERERIMAQAGEVIWGEQQDLIHTLHDALGQQLTGLGMLAVSLYQVHEKLPSRLCEVVEIVNQCVPGHIPP